MARSAANRYEPSTAVNNATNLTTQDAVQQTRDYLDDPAIGKLHNHFGPGAFTVQATRTGIPAVWVRHEQLLEVGDFLKRLPKPYVMLFDLHSMDERLHTHREGLPTADSSVFYHLISIERNRNIMLKVILSENDLRTPTFTKLFPNANWHEHETREMFDIDIEDHPHLARLLMPHTWEGRPLCKDYPTRATEFDPFELTKAKQDLETEALIFKPKDWGMKRSTENEDFIFLNLGPNHPSSHGAFRIVLQPDGEEIVDYVPDIGYHHRGAEKVGERQSWHSYILYINRTEYLGDYVNEMPYALTVGELTGITTSDHVNVIHVMLSELFRINGRLLYISTSIQGVGTVTPAFFALTDRQKIYDVVEAITGFHMHPAWFRIGSVTRDLPRGWGKLLRDFLDWMPKRLDFYEKAMLRNTILKDRSQGVAVYGKKETLDWGCTGVALRATGIDSDVHKARPYSGYGNLDFGVPVGGGVSDCYTRVMLRAEELHQSLRILEQYLNNMPEGPFKAGHPLAAPSPKERMLRHIETLVTYFLQISWGPVMSANESFQMAEAAKDISSYYLTSDGSTMGYRTRIRTPSYTHLQQIPVAVCGSLMPDLVVHSGSIDFVMSDVDR